MLSIGIWPILMGMTQFVQFKLNPAPADPVQARDWLEAHELGHPMGSANCPMKTSTGWAARRGEWTGQLMIEVGSGAERSWIQP